MWGDGQTGPEVTGEWWYGPWPTTASCPDDADCSERVEFNSGLRKLWLVTGYSVRASLKNALLVFSTSENHAKVITRFISDFD